jgi:general secretion pathway protein A
MYCNFFGFSERPFDVTPDPRFLYLSQSHREVLASLIYGIRHRRGFITVVGEVGTGKTTLLQAAMGQLDEKTKVTHIFNTDVSFEEMLHMALLDLGIARSQEGLSKVEALDRLNNFVVQQLAQGNNVVFIVDEAQNLDRRSMENLRLLSNLETPRHKLLQIVLAGQPELDSKLGQTEMRQLAQRISLKRYITPLSEEQTYKYIEHRLSIANCTDSSLFDPKALRLIWEYSGGVPRKINILCDNAFLIGYGMRKRRIDAPVVEEAIKDLSWSPFSQAVEKQAAIPVEESHSRLKTAASRPRFAWATNLLLTVCLVFSLGLVINTWLNLRRDEAVFDETGMQAAVTTKLSSPDRSSGSILSDNSSQSGLEWGEVPHKVPDEELEIEAGAVQDPIHLLHESDVLPTETNKERPEMPSHTAPKKTAMAEIKGLQVVADEGDCLSRIIKRNYGRYNEYLLSTLLRENPKIQDPDVILEGQVIQLPEE